MKKVLAVLVVIVMMTVSIPTVRAASQAYKLDEVGITVSVPDEFMVLTRDMPAYMYEVLGISQQDFLRDAEAQGIYLDGISEDYSEELVVTMFPNTAGEYSLLSETTLMAMASSFEDMFYENGVTILDYAVYKHAQTKFIEFRIYQESSGKYSLQYSTVSGGKAINVTLHSYRHSITESQRRILRGVVDSVVFHVPPKTPDPVEHTKAFVYTDKDTGLKFTVPADWKTGTLSKPREYIKAKFLSVQEEGLSVCYGYSDLWNELTPEERRGYTRDDVDMDVVDESIIEEFGYNGIEATKVIYNGVPYFCYEVTESASAYGMNVTMTMTCLMHVRDSVMYMFQFSGTSDHAYYKDFEKLIKSITYPASTSPATAENTRTTDPTASADATEVATSRTILVPRDDIPHREAALVIVWILLIITLATITAVLIALYKDSRRKKKAAKQESKETSTDAVQDEEKLYCYKCGKKIPLDSEFCPYCGARILKEETSS